MDKYENAVIAISKKYCPDPTIRDDCQQNARIAILGMVEAGRSDAYIRQAIRNQVLKTMGTYKEGNWFFGKGPNWARYISIEDLLLNGCDIREDGEIVGNYKMMAGVHYVNANAKERPYVRPSKKGRRYPYRKHALTPAY